MIDSKQKIGLGIAIMAILLIGIAITSSWATAGMVLGSSILAVIVFAMGAAFASLKIRAGVQRYWRITTGLHAPESINIAEYITLGGVRQWITVRGKDKRNPILLYLHGGPGTPLSDVGYQFFSGLEDAFVVVHWDQRGSGRSNLNPEKLYPTMTYERMVEDAAELLRHLTARFERQKIIVFGQSWGTFLGLDLAKRHPELIAAYFAMGQGTNVHEEARLTWELGKKTAAERGEIDLLERLQKLGPFPALTTDANGLISRAYTDWIAAAQLALHDFGLGAFYAQTSAEIDPYFRALVLMSPSVSNKDLLNMLPGRPMVDTRPLEHLAAFYNAWDPIKVTENKIDVPYILLMGRYDHITPIEPARAFHAGIEAPYKRYIELPYAAHFVIPEQPGLLTYHLIHELLEFAPAAAAGDWQKPESVRVASGQESL